MYETSRIMKMIDIKKKHYGRGEWERRNSYSNIGKLSRRQIAIADVILVNKIDLVSEEEKRKLLALIRYVQSSDLHSSTIFSLIRSINVTAQIYETTRSRYVQLFLFDFLH